MEFIDRRKRHQHSTNVGLLEAYWNLGPMQSTQCPRKKQATLIFDLTSPSVEIFLQFLEHFVQE